MTEQRKSLAEIGQDILQAVRNELYLNLPYMSAALYALEPRTGDDVTVSIATDGEKLFYSGAWLAERYLRGSAVVNRAYLHIVLHCLLRHLPKKRGRDAVLWDLACDAAAESVLDGLPYSCIGAGRSPARETFYTACQREMPVLTAEGIYLHLQRERLSEYELARLQRLFLADDHSLWDRKNGNGDHSTTAEQENRWKRMAERTETAMETVLAGRAVGGGAILEQVRVSAREDVDYRAFLRRFAAPREVMETDDGGFDYIYYTYGLSHYGNMPLIEPPETKEEKRIEDLVIAIDTSMSTAGETVRSFLRTTYAILLSSGTFTRRLNIRVLQCDDRVRSDVCIHSMEELKGYMEALELRGGSATDFRPVFDYVEGLRRAGAFSKLRGLLYFTDGMGIYPRRRTDYETAFILLEEPPNAYQIPPWCIRVILGPEGLERAEREQAEWEEEQDEMPEL